MNKAALKSYAPTAVSHGFIANKIAEPPTAQRLGVLLSQVDQIQLANVVANWLANKRTRRIPLASELDEPLESTLDTRFKVNVPAALQPNCIKIVHSHNPLGKPT
jgi:hypothetical protein